MALGRRTESVVSEAITSESALARENRELRAVNDILLEKVIELEDLVDELREAGKRNLENPQERAGDLDRETTGVSGADTEDRGQDQLTLFVESETSEQPSSPSAPVLAPTLRRRYKATKIIRRQESRLPNYSPHLPPLDFTKSCKAFYSDLREKRIIPDYDEDRFLCWCHVAKRAMGRRLGVIALHGCSHCATTEDEESDAGRYLPSKWISHAAKCSFYKNPWSTTEPNGTGQREFPQFPLPGPIPQRETLPGEGDEESAASHFPRGEKRKRTSDFEQDQAMDNDTSEVTDDLEQLRPISSQIAGHDRIQDETPFAETRMERMPERPAENFRQQEQLTLISNPQPLPGLSGHAPSPRQSTITGTMETIPLPDHSPHLPPIDPTKRVQIFYEDPQVIRRDECAIVAEPEAASQPPSPSPLLLKPTVLPTTTEAADCARPPETRLPDYSPHLPPIDFTKTGKSFYADLMNKRIISEYDQDRFICWCHVAKRGKNGTTGVLGNSHCATIYDGANNPTRYQGSRWIAHASKCVFYKAPSHLPKALDQEGNEESAAHYLASGEKRRRIPDPEPGQTVDEDVNAQIDIPEQPRATRSRVVEYRHIQGVIPATETREERMPEQPAKHLREQEGLAIMSNPQPFPRAFGQVAPPAPSVIPSFRPTTPPPNHFAHVPSNYSPHLPLIDRTKWGRSFFEDLKAKRIIVDYDDERWRCWCHTGLAKQTLGFLDISHQGMQVGQKLQRYMTSSWSYHAANCQFYKDPWATIGPDGMGQRKFPQFPLPEPIQQREPLRQNRDVRSATADMPRGEKRRSSLPNPLPSAVRSPAAYSKSQSKKGTPQGQTTSLPGYSPHLPPIDRTKWGCSFYEDLRAKRIIEDFDDKRWTCWCHAVKRDKIPTPRNLSISHHSSSQCYMSATWFAHAASCHFYRDPWATKRQDGAHVRLFPHFPLPKPSADQSDGVQPSETRERTASIEEESTTVLEQSDSGNDSSTILERSPNGNDQTDLAVGSVEREQERIRQSLFWWY